MRALNASPRLLSRMGGAIYLVMIVSGMLGELFFRGRVIVPGDAAVTAANLRAMEGLWRFGVATEVLMLMAGVVLTWILYILLRPVSRELALLAMLFTVLTLAVEATNELQLLVALFPLGRAEYLTAFAPEQLQAIASLSLRTYMYGFGFALALFGCAILLFGYLIIRSGYMPRAVGVLLQLGGASYLVNSFALILVPALATRLFPFILLPALVGEGSLCVWLLLKGVDPARWPAGPPVLPAAEIPPGQATGAPAP